METMLNVVRKVVINKKSPFHPDSKHLHRLIQNFLVRLNFSKLQSNYYTSIVGNLLYLIIIFPSFFFMSNNLVCGLYLFTTLTTYIFMYIYLYKIA